MAGTKTRRARTRPAHHWFREQPLDNMGCWVRLASRTEGLLRSDAFAGGHAPATKYRMYVEGSQLGVMIIVPGPDERIRAVVGQDVALEVDGHDADGGHWTVVLTGVCRTLPAGAQDRRPGQPRRLYLNADRIRGSVSYAC